MNKKLKLLFQILLFSTVLFIFLYFRIQPIIRQTVVYTYDQGRDFLKAEEIVRDRNLTFIGPTTGINGLFHGVWWYYFLTIPYLVFHGWPSGFYYAVLFINLLALLFFILFLKREIKFLSAILFFLIVSVSPYFIKISTFASNNSLTPIAILVLLYSLYQLFKTEREKYLFLIGLSLSFILETELIFGFFIIPAFIGAFLLLKKGRRIFLHLKNILLFVAGITIPSLPRILFELKNNFIQTKAMISFFYHPAATNALSFKGAFYDRLRLFIKYFREIFPNNSAGLALIFFLFTVFTLMFFSKRTVRFQKELIKFLLLLILLIFSLSLLNKDNFFWDNYLEGIHYIFLFIIILSLSSFTRIKKHLWFICFLVALFFGVNLYLLTRAWRNRTSIPFTGLRVNNYIVKFLYKENNNKKYGNTPLKLH